MRKKMLREMEALEIKILKALGVSQSHSSQTGSWLCYG